MAYVLITFRYCCTATDIYNSSIIISSYVLLHNKAPKGKSIFPLLQTIANKKGVLPPDQYPMTALLIYFSKGENLAFYLCRNAFQPYIENHTAPLQGKAATGGFFAYFEP